MGRVMKKGRESQGEQAPVGSRNLPASQALHHTPPTLLALLPPLEGVEEAAHAEGGRAGHRYAWVAQGSRTVPLQKWAVGSQGAQKECTPTETLGKNPGLHWVHPLALG